MRTNLSKEIRSQIALKVVKHSCTKMAQEVFDRTEAMMQKLEQREWGTYLPAIRDLAADKPGLIRFTSALHLNCAGQQVYFGKRYRYHSDDTLLWSDLLVGAQFAPVIKGYSDDYYRAISQEDEGALVDEVHALQNFEVETNKAIQERYRVIMGSLASFKTFEQMERSWPEIMPIANKYRPVSSQLPAINTAALNEMFDLPPEVEPELEAA